MGFYVVHNLIDEDRIKILTSKWRIGKEPLPVRTWQPNFHSATTGKEKVIAIWVRLPLLPIEYYSPQTLISIRNLIGETVALDASKSKTLQATAAKICIEANVSSYLPPIICLNGHTQEVIFENLSFFSFYHHPNSPPSMHYCFENKTFSTYWWFSDTR